MDGSLKPTNPKDAVGSGKLPIHLWPETATLMGCMGLLDGMLKYGRGNYRAIGVRASIYVDACKRHLNAWFEGEDTDPDSGLPHLAHALACLAILVDAQAAGKLTDDRQVEGGYRKLVEQLTPHVGRLKELHKDKDPKHYTIDDNGEPEGPKGLTSREIEDILRQVQPTPTWQGPHVVSVPGWYRSPEFPDRNIPQFEVRSDADGLVAGVGVNFDEDEIDEMCRLAKSGTVTLPVE